MTYSREFGQKKRKGTQRVHKGCVSFCTSWSPVIWRPCEAALQQHCAIWVFWRLIPARVAKHRPTTLRTHAQKPHRSDSQSAGKAESPEQLSDDLINMGQLMGSCCSDREPTVTPWAPECAPDISSCYTVNLTGITQELDGQPCVATHNNIAFCCRPTCCIFSSSHDVLWKPFFSHDEPQIQKNDQTESCFFFLIT